MIFRSVLFANGAERAAQAVWEPTVFADLNLDQAIATITAGKDEYNLEPFFYIPLKSLDAVNYRQEIFRDLENGALLGYIESFAGKMREMRQLLVQADNLRHKYQKASWFLDAVEIYCGLWTGFCTICQWPGLNRAGPFTYHSLKERLAS